MCIHRLFETWKVLALAEKISKKTWNLKSALRSKVVYVALNHVPPSLESPASQAAESAPAGAAYGLQGERDDRRDDAEAGGASP